MNNIYKVIWSKAKNCYVVASEIARSHTKSATGSEKIGGVTKRSLLASLMALSLLCGGLGVASAANSTVHVDESASGAAEVYTKTGVDTLLADYGRKTEVENNKKNIEKLQTKTEEQETQIAVNKTDIATNKAAIKDLNDNKLDKAFANETYATKDALNGLTTVVNGKADAADVDNKLANKADAAALAGKADKTYVDQKLTEAGTSVDTKLGNYYNKTEVDGKIADEVNARDAKINAAIGQERNDREAAITTAINGEIAARNQKIHDEIELEKTNRNAAIDNAKAELQSKITAEETARTAKDLELEGEITQNSQDIATLDKSSVKYDNPGAKDTITLQGPDGTKITRLKDATLSDSSTDAVTGKQLYQTNKNLEAETAAREKKDNELDGKITTLDGKVTTDINDLKAKDSDLEKKIQTNANNIKINKDEIARVNGELANTNDYFNAELGKTNDYFNKELSKTNNHFNTELGKTNAALQATNKRTAGIGRTDTGVEAGNQTVIEGTVYFDQKGNVSGVKDLQTDTIHANGEITSNGLNAGDGEIKTNGKVSAGNVSTGTLETTGDATIGRDLTVKGILNTKDVTAETIHVSKSEDTPDYTSKGSIIGEGGHLSVSNEKTDKRTNITKKSELNVNEEGTVNWATSTDGTTGNVTEGRSEVTADKIKNSVKKTEGGKTFGYEENITADGKVGTVTDEEGNTSSTRQDSKGIYGYAKDKDGNKSYTKQEGNRIAESVIGQDGKQTKSEMTSTDITNTAKDGTITNTAKNVTNEGTESVTNKVGANEVKVSSTDGVDITAEVGKKITESVGTASRVVENDKITDTAGNSTVTTENGKGTTFGKEGSTDTTNIYGDSIKTGTIKAKDTNTDKLTAGAAADENGGRLTVDATDGVKGSYKSGDYTSRSYILANTLMSGVDNGKKPTDTDFVGSRTDHYMVGDKAKLDETVKDANGSNVTNKTSTGTVTTITDGTGTTTTKTEQTATDITNTAKDGTITNDAKVITNKASEVINNEAININNTATGIIKSKASEIQNQADRLISNKVGENTWENMEDGKITTSIKNGTKQNLTQSDAEKTEHSVVNGSNSTVNKQTSEEITDAVTNGTTTNVTQNTATSSNNTIADKNGNANTVISTADGTSFINSKAAAPVTGASGAGTHLNTTIKGNTITTGKVTMDYADVMKDLGVHGNATVDKDMTVKGNTTLGEAGKDTTLTVNSKATFNEKATFEQGAEVKNGLTVSSGGLNVTGESTFNDKVTMKNGLDVTGGVASDSFTVKGTDIKIDSSGINAGGTVISNVADGSISEGSKDAVNGGQLYGMKTDLEHKVDKVGANAAAMANLHPMEFDPDSKWNIAAAMGNYGSETATAIGAFYRPNEDVMVNFSTAFGTGENMVGGGVSVRLGKGSNKLSREESNALKDQVNDLTARMDALLSVLNPNMSKDFPDVPENHWAYEAVSRLAGNDIVQGYPDGEFHGDRTMTRYEMAEIIYNALSRGAEAERELVEEFKPELQAMAASEKATAERAEG